MAGIGITIGIGAACGLIIGILSRTQKGKDGHLFNDHSYIEKDSDHHLQQSKEVSPDGKVQ